MLMNDDTQPKRPTGLVSPVDSSMMGSPTVSDDGPGCLLWAVVGFFSLLMGVVVVLLATLAGWSAGLQIAHVNATATQNYDVQTQCDNIAKELASGSTSYINVRVVSLQQLTPQPACLTTLIPTATALYLTSLPTQTPVPTSTPTATPTVEVTVGATQQTPLTAPTTSGTTFDPAPLFAEAQTQISSGQWREAADTLDAVMAIDPNYQAAQVKQMMYQALTQQAKIIFQSTDGNLAEGILLVTRAEQYGNISQDPLNFERTVAQLYLDALAAKDMNYPEAIRLFNQVIQYSPNYKGGQARTELVSQYREYGDRLALEGRNCDAVKQYESLLSININMPGNDAIQTKRDAAAVACAQGTSATVDPAQLGLPTTDPNQPAPPTPEGVAPIGQQQ